MAEVRKGLIGGRKVGREKTIYASEFLDRLLREANSQTIMDIELVGRATHYDPKSGLAVPWNLMGIKILVTDNGKNVHVNQLIKWMGRSYQKPFPGELPADFAGIIKDLDQRLHALENHVRKTSRKR